MTVEVLPDQPPSVRWLAPGAGARAIAGSVLRAAVAAEDDVGVTQVRLKVDGTERAVIKAAPFEVYVPVPPGAGRLRLAAVAVDTGGHETASPELEVEVTEDPGTTLRGTVRRPDGAPAAGAQVSAAGLSVAADSAGRFSLAAVPTVRVPIAVRATLGSPEGPWSAAVLLAAPVAGGVSDVGTLSLAATLFDPEPGTRLALGDDDAAWVPFQGGFTFPWFGLPRRGVWVGSNGSLTFGQADPSPAPAVPAALPGGPSRIAALLTDLVPGATAAGGQVSVLQLADRFVATWSHLPQLAAGGDNTVQAVLHRDGTVQLGYRGVTAGGPHDLLGVAVAFSPGGLPAMRIVDLSEAAALPGAAGDAVLQLFGRGNPFDLDGGFLILRPHPDGGFDVRFHPPAETVP